MIYLERGKGMELVVFCSFFLSLLRVGITNNPLVWCMYIPVSGFCNMTFCFFEKYTPPFQIRGRLL